MRIGLYVHFTSEQDARAIVASMELWHDSHLLKQVCSHQRWDCPAQCFWNCVFAVGEGMFDVPSVQRGVHPYTGEPSGFGRVEGQRHWAVVFVPEREPDNISEFGEEVEWYVQGKSIRLVEAVLMPAQDALSLLTPLPPEPELSDSAVRKQMRKDLFAQTFYGGRQFTQGAWSQALKQADLLKGR